MIPYKPYVCKKTRRINTRDLSHTWKQKIFNLNTTIPNSVRLVNPYWNQVLSNWQSKGRFAYKTYSRFSIFQTKTHAHWLVIRLWYRPSITIKCRISLLLDSHLANIQQFLQKVCQTRFPRNSIHSGNYRKIPFARDSDSTPNCKESCHVFGAQLNGIIQTQSGNPAC